MEFAQQFGSQPLTIKKGKELYSGQYKDWEVQYEAKGLNATDPRVVHKLGDGVTRVLLDGINENGMAGGMLYFPGFARYQQATPLLDKLDKSEFQFLPWEFLTWALTTFPDVTEVSKYLKSQKVSIVGPKESVDTLEENLPVHYTLHDKFGNSIVIEPMEGGLVVHDNPLGVMTNSPPFQWHQTNLRNYLTLSNKTPSEKTLQLSPKAPPVVLKSLCQGGGMAGLPGDSSSPSRFVRAVAYVTSAGLHQTPGHGLLLAQHIVNTFDMPKGWIKEPPTDEPPTHEKAPDLEYTEWSSVADLSAYKYSYRMYDKWEWDHI